MPSSKNQPTTEVSPGVRVRSEHADSGELLRLALEASTDGLILVDDRDRVVALNGRFVTLCRVPADLLDGGSAERVFSAIAHQLEVPGEFRSRVTGGGAGDDEGVYRARFRDGRVLEVRCTGGPEDAPARLRAWSFRDVTARERAESLLEETSQQYEALVRHAEAGIFELDPDTGRFLSVNEVMCRLTGYDTSELLRMDPSDLLVEEDVRLFRQRLEACRQGQAPQGAARYRWRTKDGRQSWAVSSLKLVYGARGERHLVGVALDVGAQERAEQDRRSMQEELLRAQKHESLSVMAAGIAHDFNNLLQVITGSSELLACDVGPDDPGASALARIRRAAARATELSQQMLTFAGQIDVQHDEIDLADVVHAGWELLRGVTEEGTVLRLELEPAPRVLANPSEIQRVLMNLVLNAVEAMPEGRSGVIVVRVGEALGRPSRLPSFPAAQTDLGRCAALEVEDDGAGMDAETVRRACDPFFTTKFTGRGLGLATVLGIARGHGGRILVDSRPDQGTRVKLLLPARAG